MIIIGDRDVHGSIMVWAEIALHTKTPMVPIYQNLKSPRIPLTIAIPHITTNLEMFLMQDNAILPTARTTQQVLHGQSIRVRDWPS